MKKIGKITVKHFLNTNLKSTESDEYPVYLTIWFQSKLTKTKSYWWIFLGDGDADIYDELEEEFQYMTQEWFERVINTHDFLPHIRTAMANERDAIENIVRVYFEKFEKNIVNQSPGEIIRQSLRKISDIASQVFKSKLQDQFSRSTDIKIISARLMIRWNDLSFINIYDGLYAMCNDGTNRTKFFTDVLSNYSSDYELLKLLYQFDTEMSFRFWNWVDNSKKYEQLLMEFLKSNNINSKRAKAFVQDCNAQLTVNLGMIR